MKQLALDIGLAPVPSLEQFLPGSNGDALAHIRQALAIVQAGEVKPQPLYLWGPEGSGKTHLLQAVHAALRAMGLRVGSLDAHSGLAQAFEEDWSAVLLDEVHLFDAQQQAVAFNWFVNATHPESGAPRWVLSAGTLPPTDLPLRDDLRTRLGWGHVCALQVLCESQQRLVLRRAAQERGFSLSNEVLDYMFTRFSRDLGSLVQLMEQLDRFALRTQRAITIALLKTMLESE